MVALKFLVGLLLLTILVVFAMNNMEPEVTILYWVNHELGPLPFSFALLGAAVAGSVIAALATLIEQVRLRYELRKAHSQIAKLEGDLLEYRKQPEEPIADDLHEVEDDSEDPLALPPKNDSGS